MGEFQTKLVQEYGPLAGKVARLHEIQARCPPMSPWSPGSTSHRWDRTRLIPTASHWGVVVRSRGIPAWVPIAGTGPDGLWTKDDSDLADRARTELRPARGTRGGRAAPLERLRIQRLEPLAKSLGCGRWPTAGPEADRFAFPCHGGHPGRGAAGRRRRPRGELRPLGHGVQVPARATPARPPCRPAGPGRPGLRAC